MNDDGMNNGDLSADSRERLSDVRNHLLQLHKLIMDVEKGLYEKQHGKIESPHVFLNLLMNDPWFGWLRPISEMVVRIDEFLEAREGVTEAAGQDLLREVRSLLNPVEEGEEFGVRYLQVMQDQPDIILKHAEIEKLL